MILHPKWRIYYTDDTTFSELDGNPKDAPGLGVVCIVQLDPDTGRSIVSRNDWYCYRLDSGTWWGHDLFGLLDQLTNDRPGHVHAVKAGRTVSSPDFQRIYALADTDTDFPRRSARHDWERG